MLFSRYERYQYAASPLFEVICQLRFPSILKINAGDPVEFQERLRQKCPRYSVQQEQPQARVINGKTEQGPPILNHTFISEDGTWKVNLTKDFIALSSVRYTTWEDFAAKLDEVLAMFIQVYQPAFFERIGLRYVNAFSRKHLQLNDLLWDDLINPPFIGVLSEPDVEETAVVKSALHADVTLPDGMLLHLQCGPGKLAPQQAGKDEEVKFILDHDYAVQGNMQAQEVPEKLEEMHRYAVRLFRAAVSDQLHTAMGPVPL